ncbi:GbsR/MarR family transcriptional regulator [Haloactinomyces albus]|uniref:DNA-binding transcriptional ArsR family regulator n=1 Tax=Haloactinomyces albus TaxID=1352928 RepID=A0AAE3ZFG5_9ACTN|nr:MarR family transcriptional regulator [Haloactinomyces albus]MDR7302584.1 DNA-binding transcriptional ArsR family regulator [Haloactinomyces albus]
MAERTDGPGRDEDAVARFVERFGLDLAEAGMPRMAARIFAGLLVSEDGRRTAAELAELLQVSPAAVSGAVRYLTQVGLVAREREPGQRRDHYRVHHDTWYESFAQRDEQLGRWERTLLDGVRAVGADSRAGRRIEETRDFFEFLRRELPALMDTWRRQRATGHGSDPD